MQSKLEVRAFLEARVKHWQRVSLEWGYGAQAGDATVPGFLVAAEGPSPLWAVFEDDNRTGYLYVFNSKARSIQDSVQVYVRTPQVDVRKGDVRLFWSERRDKCAVAVWSFLRAIIDLEKRRVGGANLTDRNSPGINDRDWLKGFEHLYR